MVHPPKKRILNDDMARAGTGKTATVQDKLNNSLPADIVPLFMTFSATKP